MEIISDDSFELEELPSEQNSEPVTRKDYRLKLKDQIDFSVVIDGKSYPLIDASESGVCIAIDGEAPFNEDDELAQCSIVLNEQHFNDLKGEVVHKSTNGEGNWICGVQWTEVDKETSKQLKQALFTLRQEMFENA